MASAREVYLPDHKYLEDDVLLGIPGRGPFTPLTLFVCTYVAKLDHLHMDFVELTRIMCQEPHGCLLAVNSNFGHAAQPGYECYIKEPKPPRERRTPARGRPRKVQGDGTCFNSAVEPVVAVDHPDLAGDKVYFVKCFPSTGETQVPGVVLPSLADGHLVLAAFVDYLNELGVGDEAPDEAGPRRQPVTIVREQPNMINYKFRLVRNSPRILVNLYALSAYLCLLEFTKAVEGTPLTKAQFARFAGWPAVVLPPFPVRETKSPTDDVKVSFRFQEASRTPRLNIFQEGKVNILGADSEASAERVYTFFVRLFTENWAMLVSLQPRRDLERRQALRAPRPPPEPAPHLPPPPEPAPHLPPPPANLTDAEVDALLAEVIGATDAVRDARTRLDTLAEQEAAALVQAESQFGTSADYLRWPGAQAAPGSGARARSSAVDDIVADLDAEEWGFESGPEDEDSPDLLGSPGERRWAAAPVAREGAPQYDPRARTFREQRAGDEKCLYACQVEGRRYYARGPLAGSSQDPVLGEVDREDVGGAV